MKMTKVAFPAAITAISLLMLSGCASEKLPEFDGDAASIPLDGATEENTIEHKAVETSAKAVFSVAGQTFNLAVERCVDSDDEIALSGLALSEDGTLEGYFDGEASKFDDELVGEFRVDIGATDKFQSTDTFYAMGTVGGPIAIQRNGSEITVTAPGWTENGSMVGESTVKLSC